MTDKPEPTNLTRLQCLLWHPLRALLLAAPACAAVSAGAGGEGAFRGERVDFDIPAQPLAQALTAFAEQSGVQIFFRSGQLADREATALRGSFTPSAALRKLLAESGLDYRYGANDTLVIRSEETGEPLAPQTSKPAPPLEETYVTGVRSALKQSLSIKQRSKNLVDVVTAEDIGQFPDHNVADSLQRIAGVSVDRLWGEGRDVNIRGTDKDINRTLLNGQHVASAYWWANDNPSRGFNYTTLASQLVQSLEVHKTPRAELDEGSIGGTVVVRTRRPLEMEPLEAHLSLDQQYTELAHSLDPQASFLGSWKNSADSFGVLASINWQERGSRRDGQETFADNTLYQIADGDGNVTEAYAVWGGGSALLQQERVHTTGNLTLQWAPDEHWDSALNLLRSQLEIDNTNHNFLFSPGGYKLREETPARVENSRYRYADDGNPILVAGTLTNPGSIGALLDSIHRQAYIDTHVNDLDVRYSGEQWQSHLQLGHTSARGGTDHDFLYRFTGDSRVDFRLDRGAIEVDFLDLDPRNPAHLDSFSSLSRDWIRSMENRENYAQIDFSRELEHDWLKRVKFGFKVRDHSVENNLLVGSIDTEHPLWQDLKDIGLDSVSGGLSPELSEQSGGAGPLSDPGVITRYAIANRDLLRSVINPLYDAGAMQYRRATDAWFRIDERNLAQYLSLEFERGAWSGNAGVRAVSTRQRANAYREGQPASERNRYRDLLPSLNLVYRAADDILLRGAVARVMARPNFVDLNPGISVDATSGSGPAGSGSGSAGNPQLEPYRADQLDLSLEWYFAEASLISATVFFKDISTFIYPRVSAEMVDGEEVFISRPQNGPGADIRGLELQWQQDFANGFGLLSNYTYTDAALPSPEAGGTLTLPGNSRSQFNASAYCEWRGFSARLSYNYRSRSYGEVIAGSQNETAAYRQWDAKLQWPLGDHLAVSAEAINLTDEVIVIRSTTGIPRGLYENGRRFLLGVNFEY